MQKKFDVVIVYKPLELKDFKSVSFIKNTQDLENAIINFSSQNKDSVKQRCIFNLSPNLKDWRNLLYENNSFS